MRNIFLISVLLFGTHAINAQYWQQKVDYNIDVTLDDQTHRLYGKVSFTYENNSPDILKELYIHVWPNAYRDKRSALAKQLYQSGNDELYFGDTVDRGYMSNLDFKIDGQPCTWSFDEDNPDIVKINLNTPLNPKGKLTVQTPFTVKIPSGSISRMGHIGQSYQITQWYPKPAVYDHKGWHAMSYLNQGEFYSEYGSFDVRINLPENYVVGSTGILQNKNESMFLDSLAQQTQDHLTEIIALPPGVIRDSFPVSAKTMKTLHYKQDQIHDFAWFADKRFKVLKGEVELPVSKRKVTTWAMFTPANASKWQKSIEYINDGTYYYSKWNGEYPYSAVTAIDGTISAGGGMEYPMVTVIGNASSAIELEVVIVHEVGHNWFYGILGSNERDHGWMDEGMNTANEMRYMMAKYPKNTNFSDMVLGGRLHLNDLDHHDSGDLTYRLFSALALDQAIETKSADFTSANYGLIMYQKTGLVFQYLRSYLGDELYDLCMHTYFDKYKFKHPYPEDMQKVFEGVSIKNLDWVFKDLIQTTKVIDYKMARVKRVNGKLQVRVKTKGDVRGPISVSAILEDGTPGETQWTGQGGRDYSLEFKEEPNIEFIAIDPLKNIPELNRDNNRINIQKSMFKKVETLVFEFGLGDHEPNKNNVFWLPAMAFNHSDRFMLGVTLHNFGLAPKPFQFLIMPMFSFGRKQPGGIVELSQSFYPNNGPRLVKLGLSVKSFGIDEVTNGQDPTFYWVATPYLKLNLTNGRMPKSLFHEITLKGLARADYRNNSSTIEFGGKATHLVGYASRDFEYESQIQFEGVSTMAQTNISAAHFTRISSSQTFTLKYLRNKSSRTAKLRLYGGYNLSYNPSGFLYNSYGRYSISMFGSAGYQDLFGENYYFNRTAAAGSQFNDDMGGFRTGSNYLKMSNYWATSANLTVQLPVINPNIFVAFVDLGAFDNGINTSTLFNAGLGINLADVFGLYFPLVQSNNLGNLYNSYSSSIRFTLKINPYNFPIQISKILNR